MNKSIRKNKGFSLVELLVVIVMVAVLAAIAFTVTSKIRKTANKSVTVGNMRQIGAAMIAYNSDQGRFPDQAGVAAGGSAVGTWDRLLLPFLGYPETLPGGALQPSVSPDLKSVAEIFATPEDEVARPPDTYKRSFTLPSWSANYQAPGSSTPPRFPSLPARRGVPFAVLNGPEKAAILVQWYTANNALGSAAHAYGGSGQPAALLRPFQQVLFADGHVSQVAADMPVQEFREKYWPLPKN